MRIYLTVFFLLIWPIFLYAATRNVSTSGNWSDTGTWTGGNIPGATDDVTMSNGQNLTVESTDNVTVLTITPGNTNTITIDAGGQLTVNNPGNSAFIVNNGFTLNVDGTLIVNGDFVVNNNMELNVTGTMIINGDLIMNNGPLLLINTTGSLTVDGDFIGGNNTVVDTDGTIDVTGDVDVGNGSSLSGSGTFSTGGSCADGTSAFCESSTLPVSLLYFRGKVFINNILLEWSTYEEENFDYFCVEKSSNGIDFECFEQVPGKGGGNDIVNYQLTDNAPYPGRSYYRLRAVDLDETYEYSKIIRLDFKGNDSFSIYPNPSHGVLNLRLNFIPEEDLAIQIINTSGHIIYSQKVPSFQIEYFHQDLLKPGLYIVRVYDGRSIDLKKSFLVR